MKLGWSAVMLLELASATALPRAQNTPQIFQSAVDLVRLDVSVLDHNELPIRGLTTADFTILEDGKPQPIVAFDAVDLQKEVAAANTNRVIILILQDVLVPLSEAADTKRIAREVIDRMRPDDVAAVVYTFNRDKGQEFTSDHAKLLAAVDRFRIAFGYNQQAANPFAASERGPQSTHHVPPTPGSPPEVCPDCVDAALRNAVDRLRTAPGGRKTMVLISPNIVPSMIANPGMHPELREMFAAMQSSANRR